MTDQIKAADMTDKELGAEAVAASGRLQAVTVEMYTRLLARAPESVPAEPKPVPVEPVEPSLDHNGILERLEEVTPKEEDLIAQMGELEEQPMFGEPGFVEAWTLRDGEAYYRKHWDGLGDGPTDTNAYIRSPKVNGKYGYVDGLNIDECLIENACRFGMRLHGIRSGFMVTDSVIRHIRKEHGIYLSIAGGGDPDGDAVYIADTVFRDIDSQAIQTVQRDQFWPGDALHETPDPERDFVPGETIVLHRVAVLDGAQEEGDRESFDFSFFRSRNDVFAWNTLIDDRVQPVSRGFLMVQGYHGLGDDFERAISNEVFAWRSGASKQQVASFQQMSYVNLIDGVIDVPEGSNAQITFDDCHDDIFIQNITSLRAPVRVKINGVDAGLVDDWDGHK